MWEPRLAELKVGGFGSTDLIVIPPSPPRSLYLHKHFRTILCRLLIHRPTGCCRLTGSSTRLANVIADHMWPRAILQGLLRILLFEWLIPGLILRLKVGNDVAIVSPQIYGCHEDEAVLSEASENTDL